MNEKISWNFLRLIIGEIFDEARKIFRAINCVFIKFALHGKTLPLSIKFKKEINGSVLPAHVERAKCTFNMLALLAKKCNDFFFRTPLPETTGFPIYHQSFLTKRPCH